MWIKICANTNLEDAKLAADLGADALGFVFAESARQVTPAQVAEMVPKLPDSVEKIGVFSSQDAVEIAGVVRGTGLTGVQLHGGFDLDLAQRLRAGFGDSVAIIQVLHWPVDQSAGTATAIAAQLRAIAQEPAVDRVLVDSQNKTSYGGTGESFDWTAAQKVLQGKLQGAVAVKLIAAGGLHSGNVAQAIAELRPWGVDVASGVEAHKGRKDPRKMKELIEAVRGILGSDQAGPG